MTYDYIKSMENDITEIRKYRHDFLNMLTTVKIAIESGNEGQEDALELIGQMTQEVNRTSGKRYCGCNIVNCILSHEESKLSEKNISCDFRAEMPDTLRISELDLCRLVTNLLDNAGEVCCDMAEDNRYVYCNMRICDGYLYVIIRNPKPDGKLTLNTKKEDKKLHGLGLHIVREITARYDGELVISDEENAVTVTATLKWEQA